MRALTVLGVAAGLCLSVTAASAQDVWTVTNDLEERFTIKFWSESRRETVWTTTIDPGQTLRLKLGKDKHGVELRSKGGNVYRFQPLELKGRESDMEDILTEDGKDKKGNAKYKYMNQKGFYQRKKGK